MDEVIRWVESVGLPITAYILLYVYAKTESKKNREVIGELKSVVAGLTVVLQSVLKNG